MWFFDQKIHVKKQRFSLFSLGIYPTKWFLWCWSSHLRRRNIFDQVSCVSCFMCWIFFTSPTRKTNRIRCFDTPLGTHCFDTYVMHCSHITRFNKVNSSWKLPKCFMCALRPSYRVHSRTETQSWSLHCASLAHMRWWRVGGGTPIRASQSRRACAQPTYPRPRQPP